MPRVGLEPTAEDDWMTKRVVEISALNHSDTGGRGGGRGLRLDKATDQAFFIVIQMARCNLFMRITCLFCLLFLI